MLDRFIARVRAESPGIRDDETRFLADVLRQSFVNRVNDHLSLFRSERNGLSVWRAFRECVKEGEPIPSSVLEKMAQWGERLESATNPREIAKALELVGDSGSYKGASHLAAIERRRDIASEVVLVKELYGLTNEKAIGTVARNRRLSASKVSKDFYDFFKPRHPKQRAGAASAAERDINNVMRRFTSHSQD